MNPGLHDLNNLCLQTCSNTEQAHKSIDLLFLCSLHLEICSWQRRADIPWVYCNILSNSSGYFVILCVISRMHSGTPLRLTRELLLCCCEQKVYSLHIWEQKYDANFFFKLSSLLLQSFEAFYFAAAVLWRHSQPPCDGCRTLHTPPSFSRHFHLKTGKKAISDWFWRVFTGKTASSTNLLKQDISNLVD